MRPARWPATILSCLAGAGLRLIIVHIMLFPVQAGLAGSVLCHDSRGCVNNSYWTARTIILSQLGVSRKPGLKNMLK